MHTLALYTQVPASRHDQILNILAGVTASQPHKINELHLIYQQTTQLPGNAVSKKAAAKQTPQNRSLLRHELVRDLNDDARPPQWKLVAQDIPEPGVKAVTSRTSTEDPMTEADLDRFRGNSAYYRYVNQYMAIGHRFVHSNVIARITKIWTVPEGTGALEPLDAPNPLMDECKPLDQSGTYLIEAIVRVEDGSDSTLIERASRELLSFKKQLEGCLDLRTPDRLSLDTRVKAS